MKDSSTSPVARSRSARGKYGLLPQFWPARKKKTWMQIWPPCAYRANRSASENVEGLIPWCAWMWLIARRRSRKRAARSKSSASEAAFISPTSRDCTPLLLPVRKASASHTRLRYSSSLILCVHGALQRLIWYRRHGRVRDSNTESEQERRRNARCSALSVRLTAPAEANGPK